MFESKMRQMESDLLKVRNTLSELNSGYLNDDGILYFKKKLLNQMCNLGETVSEIEGFLVEEIKKQEATDGNEE